MSNTMRAAVIHASGGPEVLKLESRPIPTPKDDELLIRVKAFGINRSELFTRQGHSPDVRFPRILGIEAVGLVEQSRDGQFKPGEVVATAMGGMGRQFDGGYAEYTCVPAKQVQTILTPLPWETLGALPEMLQTVWGSLYTSLKLEKGADAVDPRWHHINRSGRGGNCQTPRERRCLHHAQSRPRATAAIQRRRSRLHRQRFHRRDRQANVSKRRR